MKSKSNPKSSIYGVVKRKCIKCNQYFHIVCTKAEYEEDLMNNNEENVFSFSLPKVCDSCYNESKKRICEICKCDISNHPSNHKLCLACWQKKRLKNNYYNNSNERKLKSYNKDSYDYNRPQKISGNNDTYNERYKGDSDYDMGPDWDYDEFPPENL